MGRDEMIQSKEFHPDNMEWIEIFDEHMKKTIYDKRLVQPEDTDTGMMINFSKYPAGYYKTFHKHHCAHGIYVMKGILRTDKGEYGPGNFVWHPEGLSARHGATENEDCEFLFITNKPFDIYYE